MMNFVNSSNGDAMVTKTTTKTLSWIKFQDRTLYDDGVLQYSVNEIYRGSNSYTCARTGYNNPNWRSIIKSGGDATTVLVGNNVQVRRAEPLLYTAGFVPNPKVGAKDSYTEIIRGFFSETTQVPSMVSGTSLQSADNQALSRAYANLNAVQSQFQGVVFLGELKETLHLLKHPFKGVEDAVKGYLRDLRSSKSFKQYKEKRSRGNRNSFLTTAANAWLETAFGIKPLISDVKDLAEAVLKQKYGIKSSTISGSGYSIASRDDFGYGACGQTGEYKFSYVDRTTRMVRYKGRIDGTATAAYGSAEGVLNSLGFNLENFVPSLYELIPYSFLVDYFTNLGDLINAGCSSQAGLKFVVRTERTETSRAGVLSPYSLNTSNPRYWTGNISPGSVLISQSTVSRSSSSKLGMPSLEFSFPGADMHAANILALLKSNERRILKSF